MASDAFRQGQAELNVLTGQLSGQQQQYDDALARAAALKGQREQFDEWVVAKQQEEARLKAEAEERAREQAAAAAAARAREATAAQAAAARTGRRQQAAAATQARPAGRGTCRGAGGRGQSGPRTGPQPSRRPPKPPIARRPPTKPRRAKVAADRAAAQQAADPTQRRCPGRGQSGGGACCGHQGRCRPARRRPGARSQGSGGATGRGASAAARQAAAKAAASTAAAQRAAAQRAAQAAAATAAARTRAARSAADQAAALAAARVARQRLAAQQRQAAEQAAQRAAQQAANQDAARKEAARQALAAAAAVYYASCDDAEAAGVAPISKGQPGYRTGLDRNGNGIACETLPDSGGSNQRVHRWQHQCVHRRKLQPGGLVPFGRGQPERRQLVGEQRSGCGRRGHPLDRHALLLGGWKQLRTDHRHLRTRRCLQRLQHRRVSTAPALTAYAWAQVGVSLPSYSVYQYTLGQHVSMDSLMPGDLMFYADDTSDPNTIHHVAMYAGNGQMVEAPYSGAYVHLTSAEFGNGYIGATRPGT